MSAMVLQQATHKEIATSGRKLFLEADFGYKPQPPTNSQSVTVLPGSTDTHGTGQDLWSAVTPRTPGINGT